MQHTLRYSGYSVLSAWMQVTANHNRVLHELKTWSFSKFRKIFAFSSGMHACIWTLLLFLVNFRWAKNLKFDSRKQIFHRKDVDLFSKNFQFISFFVYSTRKEKRQASCLLAFKFFTNHKIKFSMKFEILKLKYLKHFVIHWN